MNANWFLDQYKNLHTCNGNEEKSFQILLQTVLAMAEQFDFLISPMRGLVDQEDCPFYLNESTTYKISCCDQINDKTWLAGAYPKATFLTQTINNVAAIEDQKNNDADMQNFFLQLESNYGDYFAGLRRTVIREIQIESKDWHEEMLFRVIWMMDQTKLNSWNNFDRTIDGFLEPLAEKMFFMPKWELEFRIGENKKSFDEVLTTKNILKDSGAAFLAMVDQNFHTYTKSCSIRQESLSLPEYEVFLDEVRLFLERIKS